MLYDTTLIGGGIVGLSTLYNLSTKYKGRFALIEKESELGSHQSKHNSGVLHAGFYKPGSKKVEISVDGRRKLIEFCDKHNIKYDLCGKVIVATSERESKHLKILVDYAMQNKFNCKIISKDELHELEPHIAGIEIREAILSPETGIIDAKKLLDAYATEAIIAGADIFTGAKVIGIYQKDNIIYLETTHSRQESIKTKNIINCAGLYADKIAEMCGLETGMMIVPIRGEYFRLMPEKNYLANRHLIYQTPNPKTPFLGVHFTKTLDNEVKIGPMLCLHLQERAMHDTI